MFYVLRVPVPVNRINRSPVLATVVAASQLVLCSSQGFSSDLSESNADHYSEITQPEVVGCFENPFLAKLVAKFRRLADIIL